MRRLSLFKALVAATLLALPLVAGASDSAASEWGRGLDLTPAQQAQVRQILREASAEADGVDASAHISGAERQARYAEIEQTADRRLYATLTPSQQKRFRTLHPDVAARLDVASAAPSSRVEGGLGESVSAEPQAPSGGHEHQRVETAEEAPPPADDEEHQPRDVADEAPPHPPLPPPPSAPRRPSQPTVDRAPVFTYDMDEMSAGRAAHSAGGVALPDIYQGLSGLTRTIFSLGLPVLNLNMRTRPGGGMYPSRRGPRIRFRF